MASDNFAIPTVITSKREPIQHHHTSEDRHQEMLVMRLDEIAGKVYMNAETIS